MLWNIWVSWPLQWMSVPSQHDPKFPVSKNNVVCLSSNHIPIFPKNALSLKAVYPDHSSTISPIQITPDKLPDVCVLLQCAWQIQQSSFYWHIHHHLYSENVSRLCSWTEYRIFYTSQTQLHASPCRLSSSQRLSSSTSGLRSWVVALCNKVL